MKKCNGVLYLSRVLWMDEDAGLHVLDYFGNATNRGCDDRNFRITRFKKHIAQSFGEGRQEKDVECREIFGRVRHKASKLCSYFENRLAIDLLLELFFELTFADYGI